MGMFDGMNISSSGLTAQRLRMDVISKNIANANNTSSANGDTYRRQVVVFKSSDDSPSFGNYLDKYTGDSSSMNSKGVEVAAIEEDDSPLRQVYDPGHPDADENGYVTMPNVNIISEMVDMISATRGYEANVTAMNASKGMMMKALEIGK